MSYRCTLLIFFCRVIFFHITIEAQNTLLQQPVKKKIQAMKIFLKVIDILHFKLVGNLNDLFNDRSNNSSYHPILLQYTGKDSNLLSIQLRVKTRGHFRRLKTNCNMPPLLLDFPKKQNEKSLFKDQHKLKLVVPCGDDDYVIREWLAYKIYNLISEKSFRAKLVQVDFEDSLDKRKPQTYYCILLEDEKKVAERNGAHVWKPKMLAMQNTNKEEFQKMAVFEYLIGNTDWSVPYLQNIVLIKKTSMNSFSGSVRF